MKSNYTRLGVLMVILGLLLSACSAAQADSPTATSGAAVGAASHPAAPTAGLPSTSSGTPTVASPAATSASSPNSSSATGSLKFMVVPDQSVAMYRVREQLASLKLPSDAIGKTNSVAGALVIQPDGKIISGDSKFTVDLSTLQSDRSMRDNFLRRGTLGTDQYPQAVFVPTSVSGLASPLPQSGDLNFKLAGDLTIRDVTKPVTWDVTGKIEAGVLTVQATTTFTFEDFNLTQPRVPVVLSVEDKITLEIDFTLQQAQS